MLNYLILDHVSMPCHFTFSRHFLFNYTLYLYIGVAFASARTIEVAHRKIPREIGGELIFEHVVKTKFTRRKRTLICDENI